MKNGLRILSTLSAVLLPSFGHAGESYSAGDIVNFFNQQKQMLVTRGSKAECDAAEIKDHKSAFDLLINFDKNSAVLSEAARGNLVEFSIALKNPRLAALHFAIDGFTDASGDDGHNQALSERRASSVVAFLQGLGVQGDVLVPRGWGETNFRTDDQMDPANRRVETRLLK
jgi:outer membrane protein OmpA-like peptidoglycan-associated protein